MATQNPVARVSVIQGKAFAKGENGTMRELKVGDPIFEGEILVASAGSQIELTGADGRVLTLRGNEALTADGEVFGHIKPDAADAASKAPAATPAVTVGASLLP